MFMDFGYLNYTASELRTYYKDYCYKFDVLNMLIKNGTDELSFISSVEHHVLFDEYVKFYDYIIIKYGKLKGYFSVLLNYKTLRDTLFTAYYNSCRESDVFVYSSSFDYDFCFGDDICIDDDLFIDMGDI